MVVVIDLEEEEAKKAAAAQQTSDQASSNGNTSQQQPSETKTENGKKDQSSQSETPKDQSDTSAAGAATTVKDPKEPSTPKPESSKSTTESTKGKHDGDGTKSGSYENKDKTKNQPSKQTDSVDPADSSATPVESGQDVKTTVKDSKEPATLKAESSTSTTESTKGKHDGDGTKPMTKSGSSENKDKTKSPPSKQTDSVDPADSSTTPVELGQGVKTTVKDSKEPATLKAESSKSTIDSTKGKHDGDGTKPKTKSSKSESSENKDKTKSPPSKQTDSVDPSDSSTTPVELGQGVKTTVKDSKEPATLKAESSKSTIDSTKGKHDGDGTKPKTKSGSSENKDKTKSPPSKQTDSVDPADSSTTSVELGQGVKTTVKDSKEPATLKAESSKSTIDSTKGKHDGDGTKPKTKSSKSESSENKDKTKSPPSKQTDSVDRSDSKSEGVTSKKVKSTMDTVSAQKGNAMSSKVEDKDVSKSKTKESPSTKVSAPKESSYSKKSQASSTKVPSVESTSKTAKKKPPSAKKSASEVKGSTEDKKDANDSTKPEPTASKSADSESQGKESKVQELKSDISENEAINTETASLKDSSSPCAENAPDKSTNEVNIKEEKSQKAKDHNSNSGTAPQSGQRERIRPPTYSNFASSLKTPTLQTWVKHVRESLKQMKLEESVQVQFSKCKTDEERITLLYNLPVVHDVLDVKECYKGKNEELAKSLRVQGNTAFQKKEYDAALKLYSDSILKAPSSGSSELPLAFANRSAVLYHKQQYVLCLQDIKQAFKHKYPDHLQYKLYERRAKACYCLRLKEDANCAFQDALNVLDKAQLDEKKLATIKADLTKQLQKCSKIVSVDSIKSARDFNHNHGPIPLIKDGRNTHIPCMGNSLELKTADSDGRGLYATRNIEAGEVLIIEKPYASVTLPDYNLTHCHHCCNRVFCPLPCGQCSGVVFCSEECRQTAWESYHYAECKYHDLIQRSELGMGHLALRMVLKAGHKYLRKYRQRAEDTESNPLLLGCNKDGVYDSSDYHTVYNLVAHTKDRSSADLFRRSLGAVFMLKCIENSGFFANVEGDENYDQDEDKVYVGGHILRHTQMLPCNAHEVTEFVYKTYSVLMSEPEEVGSAIYSTLSLINHSCDPSVVRHSYGNECVVRAIGNISKGEEIVDNYGVLYPVMSKPMRQEKLLSQYYFNCNCRACICNWPMYDKIRSEGPILKCKKCKIGRIMIPADNCTTRAICADCREVIDITPDLLHLSKSEGFYQGCLDKVLKGEERTEGLPYLVDHLRLTDRLLLRPWKDYNDCQEAIKQCYSVMANCQVLEEPDTDDEELLESEQRMRP